MDSHHARGSKPSRITRCRFCHVEERPTLLRHTLRCCGYPSRELQPRLSYLGTRPTNGSDTGLRPAADSIGPQVVSPRSDARGVTSHLSRHGSFLAHHCSRLEPAHPRRSRTCLYHPFGPYCRPLSPAEGRALLSLFSTQDQFPTYRTDPVCNPSSGYKRQQCALGLSGGVA